MKIGDLMKHLDEKRLDALHEKLKKYCKWPVIGLSLICLISTHIRSYTYLTYDLGAPASYIPTIQRISLLAGRIGFGTQLLILLFGSLILPKWQGFFALAVFVWTLGVAMML